MATVSEKLNTLIEPVVIGLGYECVGVEYIAHSRHAVLRVYIDHESGILVGDCSKVSHQLSGLLDVEDPISGEYQLEVSSPGLERPLMKLEHYQRFEGQNAEVRLHRTMDGRKKFRGFLLGLDGENILLRESGQNDTVTIPFGLIKSAHLILEDLTSG